MSLLRNLIPTRCHHCNVRHWDVVRHYMVCGGRLREREHVANCRTCNPKAGERA